MIVDYQKNRKQRGYDSLLIAAPIRIQNESEEREDAIEIVAINRSNTDVQKFYFHEAFIINEGKSLFKNGRPNRSLPVNDSPSSVYSIAQRLIAGNIRDGSQNGDIRRAVGIDETWSDDLDWSAESEVIQSGLSEALHSGNEILKGTTANEANIRRIARQLKNQYGSKINVDDFAAKTGRDTEK